jgi:hypothetical protein
MLLISEKCHSNISDLTNFKGAYQSSDESIPEGIEMLVPNASSAKGKCVIQAKKDNAKEWAIVGQNAREYVRKINLACNELGIETPDWEEAN